MNIGIVVQEFFISMFVNAVQVHIHQHTWLYRGDDDPLSLNQWRKIIHHLVNSCFYVDDSCIGIYSWFKYDLNGSLSGTRSVGYNVLHSLNTIDGSFQGDQCSLNQYSCAGARVRDKDIYPGWCNLRKLRNRSRIDCKDSQKNDTNRY